MFITRRRRRPNGHRCIWQKARANKAKASTARAKAKVSKDSKDSTDRTRTRARTTTRKIVGARRTQTKVDRRENTNPENADAHNLDSKPSIAEPEVEIDEFSMTYLNVDALQESERMRGSE